MDPHSLLAAVQRRWPDDHGPEFVKQQIATILVDASGTGYRVGLPPLGLKIRERLGTEWRVEHGLPPSAKLKHVLEGEGCFEFTTSSNTNVANAVKLNVAALLRESVARKRVAPRSPAATHPASYMSSIHSSQASAASGSSINSTGALLSGKVKVVPRPLAVKGSPKAVPASMRSPAAGSSSSYRSNGLPTLPDTLDSPPPVKPSRAAARALSGTATGPGFSGSRAVVNGTSVESSSSCPASSSGAVLQQQQAGAAEAPVAASASRPAAGAVGTAAGVPAGVAFLKRATAAAAADRTGARTSTSPNTAAVVGSGSSTAAAAAHRIRNNAVVPVSSAAAGAPIGAMVRVPKQQLLSFIQKWQFDQDVDWCHMKRALATKLVNGAADGLGMVPLDLQRTQLHVAQAGDVFHKVWHNRHPNAAKTYKKMGDVLDGDRFLSLRDGPKHSNQVVQLDIISLAAAAADANYAGVTDLPAGIDSSSRSDGRAHMRGGVHSLQDVEAAAAAATVDAAAQAVALRCAQGTLLALDLLGFAGMITWCEANEGLGLLRQELACSMIEAAHPGLAEAAAAGQLVLAAQDEARYCMSPYNATSAMLACWTQHYPGVPKPYNTLPEAFDGCRYLQLLPGAAWKVQLDIQQIIADCAATMRDMGGEWEAVAAAGAAAVAARAPSMTDVVVEPTPAAAAAATAATEETELPLSAEPDTLARSNSSSGDANGETLAAAVDTESAGGLNGSSAAYCAASDNSSSSNVSTVTLTPGALQESQEQMHPTEQQQQQQPAVPNMMQLLQLLAYAPPEICSRASMVLLPDLAQTLLFGNQGDDSSPELEQQLQQLAGSAAAAGYAAQGIQVVSDAASASQVCDHLMACPILAFGMCCSSTGSSSSSSSSSAGATETPLLLQILAPPVISCDAAIDAAVYVFDLRGQQQEQQGSGLVTLLSILLGDVRVVKLVEDAAHIASVVSRYFSTRCQGLLDVAALQELLAPAGLLEDEQAAGDDVSSALCGHISAVKQASWKLLSCNKTLRALAGRSTPQQLLPSAELVAAAAAAVRPLVSLTENAVQLLPLALMRRCLQGLG